MTRIVTSLPNATSSAVQTLPTSSSLIFRISRYRASVPSRGARARDLLIRVPCNHFLFRWQGAYAAEAGKTGPKADDLDHDPGQEARSRSEEHTSELQSRENLVCRLLLEKN